MPSEKKMRQVVKEYFVSGYLEDEVNEMAEELARAVVYGQKPLSLAQLRRLYNSAMEQSNEEDGQEDD